jgi:hypothetical protein
VYREGDRDTPLEIAEQPPRLVVAKQGDHLIRLKLDPEPEEDDEGDEWPFRLIKDGPRRIVLVFFNEQHLKLHKILGKMLDVPAGGAERVLASIKSLVAGRGAFEIGAIAGGGGVAGDARPRSPVAVSGRLAGRVSCGVRRRRPFCRPGQGGLTSSPASRPAPDGPPRSAEEQRLEALLAACPALAAQAQGDGQLPSPSRPRSVVATGGPGGREPRRAALTAGASLRLAGRASASEFQIHIRQDRDWFAASDTLKVDRSLSVDMLKLTELARPVPRGSSSSTTAASWL